MLAEKIAQDAHIRTLHGRERGGGEGKLNNGRRTKRILDTLSMVTHQEDQKSYGCKRLFQVTAFNNAPPGELLEDRTVGSRTFEVIRVDYAGPIYYRTNKSRGSKVYMLLFLFSLTRAVHIQALQNQTTNEFIRALNLFITRRGRPPKIYSDNALLQSG